MTSATRTPEEEIAAALFPHAYEKTERVRTNNSRFVHYTSAEVAMNILSGRQVWMRNAMTMNDYMEVEHGYRCLQNVYSGSAGEQFDNDIQAIYPGVPAALRSRFNAWMPGFRLDTYLTCISEHQDTEDKHGRLSMWRAYGRGSGVALVVKSNVFVTEGHVLKAYTSSVAYLDDLGFELEFQRVYSALVNQKALFRALEPDRLVNHLFWALRYAVLCTKHPGFEEEKEWRVLYSPSLEPSEHIQESVESVAGVPQRIQKIPLRNIPEKGFFGAEVHEILDRIIIGPTQYPRAIFQAFTKILTDAGVPNPTEKVFMSEIPLRA